MVCSACPSGKFQGVSRFSMTTGLPVSLAWWTMEQPSVLVPVAATVYFSLAGGAWHPGVVLLGLFVAHYINRSFIYPFVNVGRDYPIHAWASAMLFTTLNGTLQSNDLLYGAVASRPWASLLAPHTLLGAAIFGFGMWKNIEADRILRNLRPLGSAALRLKQYVIPRGGLFEYVSGAHFVGEIIEWTGFAIACWSTAPLCFAIFNWLGIGTRAVATHAWNLAKFGSAYPKDRKKLIPFVW